MDTRRIYLQIVFAVLVIFFQHSSALNEFDQDVDENFRSRCPAMGHKLKNGRMKLRTQGRIAKFQCNFGYDLVGYRFSTCVGGRWNRPMPTCVTRGCRRPSVPNSRVEETFQGAVLNYTCLPGYVLTECCATIYCDGRRWSQGIPACEVPTSQPKTSCDFESTDLCGWSHDPTHDFDWRRNQYKTPSGYVGTGPTFDHTFGSTRGGMYLYMETSAPRKQFDTARLFSPVYPKEYSKGCFVFWYHMYGVSTGALKVYVKPSRADLGELSPSWEVFGEQGNEWLRGNFTVPELYEQFQIVIEGVRGDGYVGDTAIDDVSLNQEDCDSVRHSNETESDLDPFSCRGRCEEPKSVECGCDDDCIFESNCCDDYAHYCSTSDVRSETPDEQPRRTTKPSTTEEIQHVETSARISIPTTSYHPSTTVSPIIAPTRILASTTFFSTTSSTTPAVLSTTTSTTPPATTTSTPKPTTTPIPTTSTLKPTTSTPKPTTTAIPTTSTPKPTTTPVPTTSTPKPTTTSVPTTSTPKPTTTQPPTSTPTSTTTTTTTFAPIPTTKQATTTPATTVSVVVSTASTSNKITDSILIVTEPLQRVTVTPSSTSTKGSSTVTLPSTTNSPETRTYNLRPRNRTTSTTAMTAISTSRLTTLKSTTTKLTVPTTSTTKRVFSSVLPLAPITTKMPYTASTRQRTIFKLTTDDSSAYKDAHPYKSAEPSTAGQPVVTIASVTIVVMIAVGVGVLYLFKRWRGNKQSKLADDSEMRFLSENEVIEFSDASSMDRHQLQEPLI